MYPRQQSMMSQYDPELISGLKKEIVNELKARREWQEEYDEEMVPAGGMGYGRLNRPYGRRALYNGPGTGPGRYYGWCPYPSPSPMYRARRGYLPDYDWWLDREEYNYQRNELLLRRELQQQLRAMGQMNQGLGQGVDPQVQRLLYELLRESRDQGMALPDLMQSINQNQSPSLGSGLMDRLFGPLKGIDRNSFGWGAGAAVLGFLLLPTLGKSMRPLARKAVEEAMSLNERLQSIFAHAKEEFEDIVAEASFNKLKDMSGPVGPEKPPQ